MATTHAPTRKRLWIFPAWLAAFYAAWLLLVTVGGHWPQARAHWPIAVVMVAGSYFAGSTPMGGGTISFPVLVLLFHQPATLGRDFAFAAQAVGMTSAGIYIAVTGIPVEWRMLRWAFLGSLIGTPLGLVFLAPHLSGLAIKLGFAVIWASFAVLTLARRREVAALTGGTRLGDGFYRRAGLAVGLLGGAFAAAITGVGIDMLCYVVLVLVCRTDLKIAIPTAVTLMAFTSVVGIAVRLLQGGIDPAVYGNWLAAAPVVVLGAPIGALIVARIPRAFTLMVVALLCLGQFGWTVSQEWPRLGVGGVAAAIGGVLAFNLVFQYLYRTGITLRERALLDAARVEPRKHVA